MSGLTTLHLGEIAVSGDRSSLSGMSGLTTLYLSNTTVGGDLT